MAHKRSRDAAEHGYYELEDGEILDAPDSSVLLALKPYSSVSTLAFDRAARFHDHTYVGTYHQLCARDKWTTQFHLCGHRSGAIALSPSQENRRNHTCWFCAREQQAQQHTLINAS